MNIEEGSKIDTYVSIPPLVKEEYETNIGIRSDYRRLIYDASQQVDNLLENYGKLFENDIEKIDKNTNNCLEVYVTD